ncbi:hypothetical protein P7K49_013298, partial [Saguinus oedipus]
MVGEGWGQAEQCLGLKSFPDLIRSESNDRVPLAGHIPPFGEKTPLERSNLQRRHSSVATAIGAPQISLEQASCLGCGLRDLPPQNGSCVPLSVRSLGRIALGSSQQKGLPPSQSQ